MARICIKTTQPLGHFLTFIKLTAVYWLYLLYFMPSGNKYLIATGQVLPQLKQLTDGITSMHQDVNMLKCISSLQHNNFGTPGVMEVDRWQVQFILQQEYIQIQELVYYKMTVFTYYKITIK